MISATAPAKTILFGEHAVVYARPAIAVPVCDVQAKVSLRPRPAAQPNACWLEARDIALNSWMHELSPDHPLRSSFEQTLTALQIKEFAPMEMVISSTIPIAAGLGSGAAISIAMIRALSRYFSRPLSITTINQLAFEIEKIHHGNPSGIDNTVISYRQPVYFIRNQPPQPFSLGKPIALVIADSGCASPTAIAVTRVRKRWQAHKTRMEKLFDKIGTIAVEACTLMISGERDNLGELMNQNHTLLVEMGVSNPDLDNLAASALNAGAQGAKLSGAGLGGNVIALVQPENSQHVADAMRAAGAVKCIQTEVQK